MVMESCGKFGIISQKYEREMEGIMRLEKVGTTYGGNKVLSCNKKLLFPFVATPSTNVQRTGRQIFL